MAKRRSSKKVQYLSQKELNKMIDAGLTVVKVGAVLSVAGTIAKVIK